MNKVYLCAEGKLSAAPTQSCRRNLSRGTFSENLASPAHSCVKL